MKKIIDANIILRYLLNDNEVMSAQASTIIDGGVYTIPEVLAEVVYVLKKVYNIPREEISNTLQDFLKDIELDNALLLHVALSYFSTTTLDFVDCILLAYNKHYKYEVVTFDKKLAKLL